MMCTATARLARCFRGNRYEEEQQQGAAFDQGDKSHPPELCQLAGTFL
jgi:hypothetical protein